MPDVWPACQCARHMASMPVCLMYGRQASVPDVWPDVWPGFVSHEVYTRSDYTDVTSYLMIVVSVTK